MDIIVLTKQVPDLVEELLVDANGKELDRSYMKYILNESDDHALEQALILKEKYGGTVSVYSNNYGDVDETLFTALAKGVDEVYKIETNNALINNHLLAKCYQNILSDTSYDLILTGVQSIEDIDGQIGALLATYLHIPYVGVVNTIQVHSDFINVTKEFSGGVLSEMRIQLPALIGIQAAEKPPRYVPISKIRQAQKTGTIKEIKISLDDFPSDNDNVHIRKMYAPETGIGAEMLNGNNDAIINRLVKILSESGIVR